MSLPVRGCNRHGQGSATRCGRAKERMASTQIGARRWEGAQRAVPRRVCSDGEPETNDDTRGQSEQHATDDTDGRHDTHAHGAEPRTAQANTDRTTMTLPIRTAAMRCFHTAARHCASRALPPPAVARPSAPPTKIRLTVGPSDGSMRLDRWLRLNRVSAPASLIERLCRGRHIQIAHTDTQAHTTHANNSSTTDSPQPANKRLSGHYRVQTGQQLLVPAWLLNGGSSSGTASPQPQSPSERASLTASELSDLRARVLYSDAHLLVFNKPAGLAVHGGSAQSAGRNLNAMMWALEDAPLTATAGAAVTSSGGAAPVASSGLRLVHRLDKETSGCLMLARDRHTAELLSEMLAEPSYTSSSTAAPSYSASVWNDPASSASVPSDSEFVQKRYLAIVHGAPAQPEGAMVSAAENGAICHSSYRVLAVSGGSSAASAAATSSADRFSLVELIPHTGRKRQLRLHCHHELGCTIVGEQLHMLGVTAGAAAAMDRSRVARDASVRQTLGWAASARALPLCLHAHQLALRHPSILAAGRTLRVQAPLPPPFTKLCSVMFPGWTQPLRSAVVE